MPHLAPSQSPREQLRTNPRTVVWARFDAPCAIDYRSFVTEPKLTRRISTRTRTVQACRTVEQPSLADEGARMRPASEPAFVSVATAELPECGQKIGGHCLLRALLGEGAFGRVFAAEDEETGQQVALKVVGLRRYPREYAEHELRALAAIAHPNVVHLNEHGVETAASEPYLWYTMPLYRGADLASLLKAQGHLSLARAHAVFYGIAGGVCELHDLGLRHQDIKPDNIYLATMAGVAEHHPVLLDLGGAARAGAPSPLVATFPFAAPEQAEALIGGFLGQPHEPVTEKVDVYGLSATLLFSLIGAQFSGHDIAQSDSYESVSPAALVELRAALSVIHAERAEAPLPASALPHVTGVARRRLESAFRRWLALDPSARPTAREWLTELSVLLEWDEQVGRDRAARQAKAKLLRVVAGLSLTAAAGGFSGYQWHERTMSEASRKTSLARKQADVAADELHRAGLTLDKIVADPSLGAAEKAHRITEVVDLLQVRTADLHAENSRLRGELKQAIEQAQLRAQQEKLAFDAARLKVETERDQARTDKSVADVARWKAEAERDQALREQTAADSARQRAEGERDQARQERALADGARIKAENDRDRAEQEAAAAKAKEASKAKAEAERDPADRVRAAEVAGAASAAQKAPAAAN